MDINEKIEDFILNDLLNCELGTIYEHPTDKENGVFDCDTKAIPLISNWIHDLISKFHRKNVYFSYWMEEDIEEDYYKVTIDWEKEDTGEADKFIIYLVKEEAEIFD